MESFKNQVAVVTGASSGIGKAIALSVAAQGTEVCLVARRRELLEEVSKQAQSLGSRGHACPADLTKDDDIRGLGERFQKDFGHVNILVLCGGAIFHGPLEKASVADLDLMYRSNVRGHYLLIQTMLPLLRKSPGQIVFINSSAGLRSPATTGQFSATQHAFRSIADSLRDEVNAMGIRRFTCLPRPHCHAARCKIVRKRRPRLPAGLADAAGRRSGNGDPLAPLAAHRRSQRHQHPPDAKILLIVDFHFLAKWWGWGDSNSLPTV